MFNAISTGKNRYYGQAGERINIGDSYLLICLKEGWIKGDIKYLGTSYGGKVDQTPKTREGYIIQRVNVEKLIEMQNKALIRIQKELEFSKQKHNEIRELLNGMKFVKDKNTNESVGENNE